MSSRRAGPPSLVRFLLAAVLLIAALPPAFAESPGAIRDVNGALPWNANAVSPTGSPDPLREVISSWEIIGPFGGEIADVAASPLDANLLLAGLAPANSNGTLFRSTNGGTNWFPVPALVNNSVYDVEFTPTGIAYVGTLESIWKSTDGGVNWTHLNLGIGLNDQVFDVAVDPNNELVLWIGVGDGMGTQPQTVLRSTDGGTSWVNRTPIMTTMSCKAIVVKANDSNRVYAAFGGGTGGGAFWVSTNGGSTWTNRSAGLPARPMNDVAHDGARVLVCGGQLFGSQTFGLYASTNDGANWSYLSTGWPNLVIQDIAIDPNNANVLLVASQGRGVFRSTNAGVNWEYGIGGTNNFPLNSVRFGPASSTRVYLGVNSLGVWKSTDGGANFTSANVGIAGVNITGVTCNPLDPTEYAVCFEGLNDGGIYSSTDAGVHWTLEPVPGTRWNAAMYSPQGVLYALSDGPSSIAPEAVYRRNGDGTWTSIGPDQGTLFETELHTLVFSATNDSLLLAGGADFGVAGNEGTVWISKDAGATWLKSYEGASSEMILDLAWVEDGADSVAVAALTNWSGAPGGALRTINGGLNWDYSSTGLSATARGADLSSPVGEPNTFYYADQMYSVGGGGLYKSTDGGINWAPTGYVGTGTVAGVLCHPEEPGTIFILRPAPERVLVSTDAGATFGLFNTGLGSAGYPYELAMAGGTTPRLLLATGNGTYATLLLTPESVGDPSGFAREQLSAWPNPASTGGVTLRLPAMTAGTVEIHDASGALVRSLAANGPTLVWDGRASNGQRVASGVYWASIRGQGAAAEPCRVTILR